MALEVTDHHRRARTHIKHTHIFYKTTFSMYLPPSSQQTPNTQTAPKNGLHHYPFRSFAHFSTTRRIRITHYILGTSEGDSEGVPALCYYSDSFPTIFLMASESNAVSSRRAVSTLAFLFFVHGLGGEHRVSTHTRRWACSGFQVADGVRDRLVDGWIGGCGMYVYFRGYILGRTHSMVTFTFSNIRFPFR